MQNDFYFDITFIGSGLSCTYTLAHCIRLLEQNTPRDKLRLLIIEKTGEFWTGIPYGKRSGKNSLIITPLKEFIPENERLPFLHWLKVNKKQICRNLSEQGDLLASNWLENNKKLLSENQWDNIYIPRYLFGFFLTERINHLLKNAVENGLIQYKLLSSEVKSVNKCDGFHQIKAFSGEAENIYFSKKIALSIGSPHRENTDALFSHSVYIKDLYHPGLNENLFNVWEKLKNAPENQNNVLLIGSNASALEVLYNLQNNREIAASINKIYVLSPNGAFPGRINIESQPDFHPRHLTALENRDSFTARQILKTLKKDLQEAVNAEIQPADTVHSVSKIIIPLLNKLDFAEQKKFVEKYGVEIGKLQRRAGAAYCNAATEFITQNKLEFVKGKFLGYNVNKELPEVKYYDIASKQEKVFPEPVAVIINCSGFQSLSKPPHLLKRLIKQKICKMNNSKRGIEVNENFEASDNFYIIGPLLAGNLNKNLRVWHAESCPRIFSLSKQLAEILAKEYQTESSGSVFT